MSEGEFTLYCVYLSQKRYRIHEVYEIESRERGERYERCKLIYNWEYNLSLVYLLYKRVCCMRYMRQIFLFSCLIVFFTFFDIPSLLRPSALSTLSISSSHRSSAWFTLSISSSLLPYSLSTLVIHSTLISYTQSTLLLPIPIIPGYTKVQSIFASSIVLISLLSFQRFSCLFSPRFPLYPLSLALSFAFACQLSCQLHKSQWICIKYATKAV